MEKGLTMEIAFDEILSGNHIFYESIMHCSSHTVAHGEDEGRGKACEAMARCLWKQDDINCSAETRMQVCFLCP